MFIEIELFTEAETVQASPRAEMEKVAKQVKNTALELAFDTWESDDYIERPVKDIEGNVIGSMKIIKDAPDSDNMVPPGEVK